MSDIKIALAGNPNSGKTTVFNALTGSNQYVGNWAGVTVEKKEGSLKSSEGITLIDLPGIYSLSPYSPEEIITRDYILKEKPDVILNAVDSANLERNLYLTLQLMETGTPLVLMLNLTDSAEKKGIVIDEKKLSEQLGVFAAKTSAAKGQGVKEAAAAAKAAALKDAPIPRLKFFSSETESALKAIEAAISGKCPPKNLRWYSVRLFEREEKAAEELELTDLQRQRIEAATARCEKSAGTDSAEIIASERYDYIERLMSDCRARTGSAPAVTERIDGLLTGKYTALPFFILIMTAVYFLSAGPIGAALSSMVGERLIGGLAGAVSELLSRWDCAAWLRGLIVDGIIGGVGSVIGFLPQLFLLFFMLSLLEDCGYMSRVAFIMDRFFRFFGLSGKSFIPLLIATGCGVPAIMSSRTVDNEAGRKMTIITSTFMPCGAKLPLIAMISTQFFGGSWWVAPVCYFAGIASVLLSGLVLKNTKPFKACNSPFIMELPDYRMPMLKNIFRTVGERCGSFIKRAGTTILLASMAVWFLANFGIRDGSLCPVMYQGDSILFALGEKIAPVFEPIGFGSWQAAVATLMGFLAKEEIVGVFGVIASVQELPAVFGGSLGAFSFMLFNLLCAPCIAAMTAIAKEMRSFKWTLLAIGYQTGFAYLVCFLFWHIALYIEQTAFCL
ncbi:MAG: ferrous iron transport protein B [Firmicutes bacterium]|nr:ferrous iron transport protein B [[Eubacterium] siraeum]MCM1488347.1 ferrous iron transport protein B [Bacillota bacterium]